MVATEDIPAALEASLGPPVLKVESASIAYWLKQEKHIFQAVEEASFELPTGCMLAIVGPSGCGKSSLLAAIAGLMPYGGSIQVEGKPVTKPSPTTSMVFQRPALLPWMRVKDNVAYGLRARGMSKSEAIPKAMHALESVGLTNFADRYPYQLSGGMQQRAGLARAMVTKPALLLLDEPFAAVDALTRESLQNDLLTMWERKERSGVIVTHQLDEAILLADMVAVMSKGPSSRIKAVVPVDLPRPRDPSCRYTPRFTELNRILADLLDLKT